MGEKKNKEQHYLKILLTIRVRSYSGPCQKFNMESFGKKGDG